MSIPFDATEVVSEVGVVAKDGALVDGVDGVYDVLYANLQTEGGLYWVSITSSSCCIHPASKPQSWAGFNRKIWLEFWLEK